MALFLNKEMLLLWHYLLSSCFHTSQVKEINIVFLCGVSDDGTIFKAPFLMKQLTVSLTGEALSEDLFMEMLKIRDLGRKSVYDRIEDTLKSHKKIHKEKSPEEKYHLLRAELKVNVKLYMNNSLLKKLHACSCWIMDTWG